MVTLDHVAITGFKSIRAMDLDLGRINVLIGANGAGKSNLVSLFKMLNFVCTEALQEYVSRVGGANSLLHYGVKTTPQMEVEAVFQTETGQDKYYTRLSEAAPDCLFFSEERVEFHRPGYEGPQVVSLGGGHRETKLNEKANEGNQTVQVVRNILGRCRVFQFHDTSESARIRKGVYVEDNRYLRSDAGNLAAYLHGLKERSAPYYERIVKTVRQAAPQFDDFELAPSSLNANTILLNWREVGSDYLFGPHQLPDGLLRFMAIATLLLQPEDELPDVVIIDEPELGLHPYAINLLGAMLRKVSLHSQVILATQSLNLVDQFRPEDIVVVERREGASQFRRLKREDYEDWREEYSLSELWEKNVIGGVPSR